MIKILALSVITVTVIQIIKPYKNEYALLIKIAAVILFGFLIINEFSQNLNSFPVFNEQELFSQTYFKNVLKILGIVLVTQLSSNICKDSGETTLSFMVELVGKISILAISMPMIESLYLIMKNYLDV